MTAEDQQLQVAERELAATETARAAAQRRVDEPSPSDDFEEAFKALRLCEWNAKLAKSNRDAARHAKEQMDLRLKQEELQKSLSVASVQHLLDATDEARAQLKRAFVQARAALLEIQTATIARDAAAKRARELAGELGMPTPVVWTNLGIGPVAAAMFNALKDEQCLPLDPTLFWKTIPDLHDRSHAIIRCFDVNGMDGVVDRTAEQKAEELMSTGTDPRIAYGERVAERTRIGTEAFEKQLAKDKAKFYDGLPASVFDKALSMLTGEERTQ